jgi:hypothetical protein
MSVAVVAIEWVGYVFLAVATLYALYLVKWAAGIDLIPHGGPHLPIPRFVRRLRGVLARLARRHGLLSARH